MDSVSTYTSSVLGGTWTGGSVSGGIFSPSTAGTYTLTYTVANSCGTYVANKTVTVNNCSLGVSNITTNSISIYPNPVTDVLNVEGAKSIIIANMFGQIVYTGNSPVNMKDMTVGMYMVRVDGIVYKVMKQ